MSSSSPPGRPPHRWLLALPLLAACAQQTRPSRSEQLAAAAAARGPWTLVARARESPPPPAPLPDTLDEVTCPAAREPLPKIPSLAVLALADEAFKRCAQNCGAGEQTEGWLQIEPDGQANRPSLVEPAGCFADRQVQGCIAAAWAKLCFEPSTDGVQGFTFLIGQNPFQERVPLVRLAPVYPMKAARKGIEGHVEMRFDVDPEGKVANIEVTESVPPGVFDRAATRALQQWRYHPKYDEDGQPIWRRGLSLRMPFKLR